MSILRTQQHEPAEENDGQNFDSLNKDFEDFEDVEDFEDFEDIDNDEDYDPDQGNLLKGIDNIGF